MTKSQSVECINESLKKEIKHIKRKVMKKKSQQVEFVINCVSIFNMWDECHINMSVQIKYFLLIKEVRGQKWKSQSFVFLIIKISLNYFSETKKYNIKYPDARKNPLNVFLFVLNPDRIVYLFIFPTTDFGVLNVLIIIIIIIVIVKIGNNKIACSIPYYNVPCNAAFNDSLTL